MFFPIIFEIIELMECNDPKNGKSNYAKSLVLGAAFASLAGGFTTEIGTAPNLMAVAYTHLPFLDWTLVFHYL